MSVNVKALRALLDKAKMDLPVTSQESFDDESLDIIMRVTHRSTTGRPRVWSPVAENVPGNIEPFLAALLNSAPDLLALAEAVRELAPMLAMLSIGCHAIPMPSDIAAARRVTAILEGK